MRRSALVLLFVLALPAAAPAQTPSPLFAGGSAGTGAAGKPDPGNSEIGLRVIPGGKIAVRAVTYAPCAGSKISEIAMRGVGALAADGTFAFRLKQFTQIRTRGFKARLFVTGRIEGSRATGTLDSAASGGTDRLRSCRGRVAWVALNGPPQVGPDAAAAPAGAALVGMTSRTSNGPFGIALRVSGDGARVVKLLTSFNPRCRRLRVLDETNFSPAAKIGPDGAFTANERFKIRFSDAVDSVDVRMSGRFVSGGATGRFRFRVVSRSRRTGRVTDRCDSGTTRWSAAVV